MLDKTAIREQPASLEDVLDELRALRRLVEQRIGAASDDGDVLTVPVAAALAHRSQQTIRNWCTRKIDPVGRYDVAQRRFLVSRTKLAEYCKTRFGAFEGAGRI